MVKERNLEQSTQRFRLGALLSSFDLKLQQKVRGIEILNKKQSLPKIIYSHLHTIFETVLDDTICISIKFRRTVYLGRFFYFKGDVRFFCFNFASFCFVYFNKCMVNLGSVTKKVHLGNYF